LGIGHFAVGLALKKAEPRLNAGWLVFGAYLSDFLLGIFVWLGIEQYQVPPDLAAKHYLTFTFPYSHGLGACLLWSAIAGMVTLVGLSAPPSIRKRAAWIMAAAVLSHFFLDALVHVRGLPLWGEASPKIGLALWNHLPLELSLEAVMVAVALPLYLSFTRARNRMGRYGMIVLLALLTPLTIFGQWSMKTAPPAGPLIAGWIATPIAFAALASWLDRQRWSVLKPLS
jgi:hypothetical protein